MTSIYISAKRSVGSWLPARSVESFQYRMDAGVAAEESRPLLQERDRAKTKRMPTPLPKLQIGILMLLHLAEPITAHCIFPFIKQVCPLILPCALYLVLTTSGIT